MPVAAPPREATRTQEPELGERRPVARPWAAPPPAARPMAARIRPVLVQRAVEGRAAAARALAAMAARRKAERRMAAPAATAGMPELVGTQFPVMRKVMTAPARLQPRSGIRTK